jgi:hypothetical protein
MDPKASPSNIRQIKSRIMRWAEHVARIGEEGKLYRVLVGKPEGKKTFGRPRRRWEDGIRIYLRDICWGSVRVDCIQLAQDRDRWRALANTVMYQRFLTPRSQEVSQLVRWILRHSDLIQSLDEEGTKTCTHITSYLGVSSLTLLLAGFGVMIFSNRLHVTAQAG